MDMAEVWNLILADTLGRPNKTKNILVYMGKLCSKISFVKFILIMLLLTTAFQERTNLSLFFFFLSNF